VLTDTYYCSWHACGQYEYLGEYETPKDAAKAAVAEARTRNPDLKDKLYLGWGLVADVLRLDVDRLHAFFQHQADSWHDDATLLAEVTERWVMDNASVLKGLEHQINQAHGTNPNQGWLAYFAVFDIAQDGTATVIGQERGYVP
jgi:hypothetical protein